MSEMQNQITFEPAGLGALLIRHWLVLPPNQREYSWEPMHVKQLLEDFAKAISDNGKGYFLGTLVTIPRADGVLEVVDGQQRLATTSLLLAAIRDYLMDSTEPEIAEAIRSKYLASYDMSKRMHVTKLRLNVDDNDLFTAIVNKSPRPPTSKASHRKLIEAYDMSLGQVRKIVAPHDVKNHADVLAKWVTFIELNAFAILVRVADGANAYKMFETLNDRGLKTTQADLIKSFLFEKSGGRIAEVQSRWSHMRGALEGLSSDKDQTVTFLRHALTVQRGQVRENAVYETVQSMAKNEDDAVTTANNLENLATAYVATFNPEHERWNGYAESVRRAIVVFNLLATRPLRPLMLAIAFKFDKKETAHAFQFLVSLSARLTISGGTSSGSIDETAAAISLEIFTGKVKTVSALKKALMDITPTDERFKEATAIAKSAQPKFARYYLRSLEMAAKGEKEPYFVPMDDSTVINLEHVLPKKPLGNWPNFTEDQVDVWVNRLGNQALMRASENSDAKSDSFADKKPLYAKSAYSLTKSIAQSSDWTTSSIERRQKALAELAVKTWPI